MSCVLFDVFFSLKINIATNGEIAKIVQMPSIVPNESTKCIDVNKRVVMCDYKERYKIYLYNTIKILSYILT